jgi:hypothetical protein
MGFLDGIFGVVGLLALGSALVLLMLVLLAKLGDILNILGDGCQNTVVVLIVLFCVWRAVVVFIIPFIISSR